MPQWAFWLTLAVMLIGLIGAVVPALPGIELIWLAALIYAVAGQFTALDPLTFGAMTLLAAVGLTAQIWVSHLGGKLGGASWKALLAGLGLGALGFLIGLAASGIGALPAGLAGALTGVLVVEYRRQKDWKATLRAGVGWMAGCLLSGVVQLAVGIAMLLLFIWRAAP